MQYEPYVSFRRDSSSIALFRPETTEIALECVYHLHYWYNVKNESQRCNPRERASITKRVEIEFATGLDLPRNRGHLAGLEDLSGLVVGHVFGVQTEAIHEGAELLGEPDGIDPELLEGVDVLAVVALLSLALGG